MVLNDHLRCSSDPLGRYRVPSGDCNDHLGCSSDPFGHSRVP